jgi:hypothetical protein
MNYIRSRNRNRILLKVGTGNGTVKNVTVPQDSVHYFPEFHITTEQRNRIIPTQPGFRIRIDLMRIRIRIRIQHFF